ncbi:hypothetical protein L484_020232 [Morus notabilis]|uniref:SHSP domain-containing protein n=1 Tax=Morus notabilis TaxID=981085 RepID=W9RVF7_9ROSA|nr:uncharacterized protein LOC21403139 [Morus notabilis]EXB97682.1 hypothetical protein L484_020232 [Morus notabilis]
MKMDGKEMAGGVVTPIGSPVGGGPVDKDFEFEPQTETHEEEGARIVVSHLPGFREEDIRIMLEHANNIRVKGQSKKYHPLLKIRQIEPITTPKEYLPIRQITGFINGERKSTQKVNVSSRDITNHLATNKANYDKEVVSAGENKNEAKEKYVSAPNVEKLNRENGDHAIEELDEKDRQKFINVGVAILCL